MVKQLLTFGFCALTFINGFSQNSNKCATMPVYNEHLKDPNLKANFVNAEIAAKNWLSNPINKLQSSKNKTQ